MAKTHERVFALVGALLFLGTTVVVSVLAIWQIHQQNQANKPLPDCTNSAVKNYSLKEGEKLEGTLLADFTPCKTSQLQTIDLHEGSGDVVKASDTITAHYTGATASDGVIFQSSHDMGQPTTFPLGGVIKGWTDGVPGMKVGGKRRLLIPAAMAYGANPPQGSGIPANADLVFDIELVKIGE